MPYLQLDVNGRYPSAKKRELAKYLAETYTEMMAADIRRITVAIREAGADSIWRIIDGEPVPAALLMCDIRRGRDAERRMALAEQLIALCADTLDLPAERINVEFTQHAGDEMFHPALGGYSPEWGDDDT